MNAHVTHPQPGVYRYSYPTFVDSPQHICVHFLTPDQRQAFVSYPNHPNHKAAQLIPLSWFKAVNLVKLAGQPQLMHFLEVLFCGWRTPDCPKIVSDDSRANDLDGCAGPVRLAA